MPSNPVHPFVIGVTGPIACGKSTVLRELHALGATTIDADLVYHSLAIAESPLFHELVEHFGERIVGSDGEIDRKVLGEIVFGDPEKLRELDGITHPAISAEIRRQIGGASTPVVAIDAVKLIEGGTSAMCDEVWLVTCNREQRIERLVKRDGWSPAEAAVRVDAHTGVGRDHPAVGKVVDNGGSIESTLRQVRIAWKKIEFRLDSYEDPVKC